jgi:threonine aldolase
MADRLSQKLTALGFPPIWRVEANEVFVTLPADVIERLTAAGASFYQWMAPVPKRLAHDAAVVRLVASFATSTEEVDQFVETVARFVK